MDFLKVKGSHTQEYTKHIINPQQDKRGRKELRPFFLRIHPKGKSNYNDKAGKTRKEDKQKTTGAKRQKKSRRTKAEQKDKSRDKSRDKRIKRKANTPQAPKPPNHSRTQKPHKPRKARR